MVKRKGPKATGYSERLRLAREAAGLSLMEAAYQIRPLLSRAQWASNTKIARLEQTIPEEKADPMLLWALARVYGVPLEQISPHANDWIRAHFTPTSRAWNTAVREAA